MIDMAQDESNNHDGLYKPNRKFNNPFVSWDYFFDMMQCEKDQITRKLAPRP